MRLRFQSCFVPVVGFVLSSAAMAQLPPPPFPPENPPNPAKSVLGKILFWDEQLSSDDTVACGTCHRPLLGGSDPRVVRTTGLDGLPNTRDDRFGSPGVVRQDPQGLYAPDAVFGVQPQVTNRHSPTFVGAAYFDELFWDGRARGTFVDPVTGVTSIIAGGALESQSVGPPTSDVEMAHEARDWSEIIAKLERVTPLRLASALTPDIVAALASHASYAELFAAAFGDPAITSERIAFAIATYERTLVPDQTPWDRFNQGDSTALTPGQQAGLGLFTGRANCSRCHTLGLFSDNRFHNIGLRPPVEDLGRQNVTGDPADRGRFKTPTLRNAGLRGRYMHTGELNSLQLVVNFYNGGGNFPDNRDPLIVPLGLAQQQRNALADFVANGLTDPRVAAEAPPFDRPRLHSESQPPNPRVFGPPNAGSGGFVPLMIAHTPPALGSPDFKLGIGQSLGGATAHLAIARTQGPPGQNRNGVPVLVALSPLPRLVTVHLSGAGAGGGFATWLRPLPNRSQLAGRTFFVQWFVTDPGATGGFASTPAAEVTLF
ncbi:MAG: hypothetical protein HYR85_02900 [Planctomycetes bacterium]|nr:hypothetical protein [Planctomycetota bacterium]MBI3843594.1 hypothetical protein [Planctomycetota bacterium]